MQNDALENCPNDVLLRHFTNLEFKSNTSFKAIVNIMNGVELLKYMTNAFTQFRNGLDFTYRESNVISSILPY